MTRCNIVRRSKRIAVLIVSFALLVVLGGCQPLMLGWLVGRPDLDGLDNAPGPGLLESLQVSDGTLVPEFDSQVWDYEVVVPYSTTAATVTAVSSDLAATVSENSGVPQQA